MSTLSAMSQGEQVIFRWNDGDVHFVCDQQT
jgi:hypothetical protein